MKSDASNELNPPNFREGEQPSEQRKPLKKETQGMTDLALKLKNLFDIFSDLEEKVMAFMKHELEKFKELLGKETTKCYDSQDDNYRAREGALDIALHFLKKMDHNDLANTLEKCPIEMCQRELKLNLKKSYECVSEGIAVQGDRKLLEKIYTELYITEGGIGAVNKEHEVRQIEKAAGSSETQEKPIKCNNIFQALPGQDKPIRTVLTKGVAGVGKSISVQKFILDWVKENANQDIGLIFPLPFRELNLMTKKVSFVDILHKFFPETKGLMFTKNKNYKVLFVFDGLDEYQHPLAFHKNEIWSDITAPTSVDVLLTNLIKGNLLPSALIWITTRPAAASRIPPDCIDQVAEIRGFNDEQKEEYFRKRITDVDLADRVIEHIRHKESRSLYIMCHIPVFCWIAATVLERILEKKEETAVNKATEAKEETEAKEVTEATEAKEKTEAAEATEVNKATEAKEETEAKEVTESKEETEATEPTEVKEATEVEEAKGATEETEKTISTDKQQTLKTLTQMYSHFLIFQTRRKTEKYGETYDLGTKWDEKSIMALGQLAFQNLLENNLIFCESDLKACGITVEDASVYSGMCTQIFKEDLGVFLDTAFCFVHLTIQEFFAALYAHMCINKHQRNVFVDQNTSPKKESNTVIGLLKNAVDKALGSDSGQLDLFLRFILGFSLESNQKLLQGLLTQTGDSSQSKEEIVRYIKEKFKENPSAERSINLFHCLNELNDKSLVEEIQNHLKSGSLTSTQLSSAQWSALVFVLLTSEEQMEEFDLKKFIRSDECLRRLLPVVKTATKALLDNCNLTPACCSALATVLSSNSSSLRELDLDNNKIQDLGVQFLATQLHNPQCKLEILRLSDCGITGEGYANLASALKSNPSHLMELDMRGNDPGDSGVKLLLDLQKEPACKLKKIRLLSDAAEKACAYLTSVLGTNPLLLTELDLNGKKPGDSGVKQLSAILEDSHCRLGKITLNDSGITEEGCATLTSALSSNPSHLTELNLGGNKLGDSGVKHIYVLLENPDCKLQKLGLSDCSVTGHEYAVLASALKSNTSHLVELDLRGNNPGDSGVKLLTDVLLDPDCKLKRLRLLKSDAAEEACKYLTSVLRINPLLLKELDLSGKRLGDSGVKQISALLEDSQCTWRKLSLSDNSVTGDGYAVLTSALKSNPSHLVELDLRGNNPGDSGVKLLTDILLDPDCKLKTLRLLKSDTAEKACAYLTSVQDTNPLLLTDLDLGGKKLGDSGVKQLCALLGDSHCKLKTLNLSDCRITGDGYAVLASALKSNTSHLVELDLRGNNPGDSGVKLITDVLQDPDCKLKRLRLLKSDAAKGASAYLTSVLDKNPLLLKELDLSGKRLGDSGVKQISALLEDSQCTWRKLNLSDNRVTGVGYAVLTSALKSNPSHLVELDLRGNDPGDSGVKLLTDLHNVLNKTHCKLRLLENDAAEKACAYLTSVLGTNPLLLTELDLSGKKPGDSRVKQLCALLEDSHCKLKTLNLSDCKITGDGYVVLASALKSSTSHLVELDLRGNNPGDSGVKLLTDVLQDPDCKLKRLRLLKSDAAEEASAYLTSVLDKNPLLLKELNLSGKRLGDSGVKQISALLEDSQCTWRKLNLSDNRVTGVGYAALTSALKSNPSHLVELDLRGNDPGDSGVKLLTDLHNVLNKTHCKLRLLENDAAEKAFAYLTSVLGTNPLLLTELDLSGKKPGDSTVKQLCALLEDSHCKLKTLKLKDSNITEESCAALTSALTSNPSHLIELNLSGNKLGRSGVIQISSLLTNLRCKLEKLELSDCSVTGDGYAALALALKSNPSQLVELDLRGNDPGDSGVKLLTDLHNLLDDQKCKLQSLRLLKCDAADEACAYLTSVLGKNPLLLTELDLSGKKPGDSGVKQFCALLGDSHCKLKKLKLNDSSITAEGCADLTLALRSNPSHLIELNLSGNKLEDLGVKHIPALLQNPHSKLQRLLLNKSSITAEGCDALTSALRSNPSHLIELNLSGNKLRDSGVKHISVLLENPHCKLEKLLLSDCGITGEGYATLTSALKSNPSHLIELDLRGNNPGDSGVKLLTDLHNLLNVKKLQTLRLLNSDAAEEACDYLTSVLGTNPLLLTELDLSGKKPGDSGVKQFCALLKDSHCKLTTLKLNNSSITAGGCAALTSALSSNPSHLIELDLSGNKPGDSGVDYISALLQDPNCKLQRLLLNDSSITERGCATLTSALTSNPSHLTELHLKGNQLGDSVKLLSALLVDPNYKLEKLELDHGLLKTLTSGAVNVMTNLPGAGAVSSFVTSLWSGKQEQEPDSSAQRVQESDITSDVSTSGADGGSALDQEEQESDTTSGVSTSGADGANAGH
ncbi:uncharacterized protein LOC122129486 isoform X3 [Clupea harengus]|uniref:Uncharacterized protein LOC122129486 isoform X3 n=1 Tax=Clupea harengus TaxID=7950 RepID=A0A8M1KCX0_CLUHA|nr:uncharacterized protein LOC122129486 isoform X3 [Clupea harengus]